MKSIKIKLPKIFTVVDEERAKKDIDSDKYLVLMIPIEDIEIE